MSTSSMSVFFDPEHACLFAAAFDNLLEELQVSLYVFLQKAKQLQSAAGGAGETITKHEQCRADFFLCCDKILDAVNKNFLGPIASSDNAYCRTLLYEIFADEPHAVRLSRLYGMLEEFVTADKFYSPSGNNHYTRRTDEGIGTSSSTSGVVSSINIPLPVEKLKLACDKIAVVVKAQYKGHSARNSRLANRTGRVVDTRIEDWPGAKLETPYDYWQEEVVGGGSSSSTAGTTSSPSDEKRTKRQKTASFGMALFRGALSSELLFGDYSDSAGGSAGRKRRRGSTSATSSAAAAGASSSSLATAPPANSKAFATVPNITGLWSTQLRNATAKIVQESEKSVRMELRVEEEVLEEASPSEGSRSPQPAQDDAEDADSDEELIIDGTESAELTDDGTGVKTAARQSTTMMNIDGVHAGSPPNASSKTSSSSSSQQNSKRTSSSKTSNHDHQQGTITNGSSKNTADATSYPSEEQHAVGPEFLQPYLFYPTATEDFEPPGGAAASRKGKDHTKRMVLLGTDATAGSKSSTKFKGKQQALQFFAQQRRKREEAQQEALARTEGGKGSLSTGTDEMTQIKKIAAAAGRGKRTRSGSGGSIVRSMVIGGGGRVISPGDELASSVAANTADAEQKRCEDNKENTPNKATPTQEAHQDDDHVDAHDRSCPPNRPADDEKNIKAKATELPQSRQSPLDHQEATFPPASPPVLEADEVERRVGAAMEVQSLRVDHQNEAEVGINANGAADELQDEDEREDYSASISIVSELAELKNLKIAQEKLALEVQRIQALRNKKRNGLEVLEPEGDVGDTMRLLQGAGKQEHRPLSAAEASRSSSQATSSGYDVQAVLSAPKKQSGRSAIAPAQAQLQAHAASRSGASSFSAATSSTSKTSTSAGASLKRYEPVLPARSTATHGPVAETHSYGFATSLRGGGTNTTELDLRSSGGPGPPRSSSTLVVPSTEKPTRTTPTSSLSGSREAQPPGKMSKQDGGHRPTTSNKPVHPVPWNSTKRLNESVSYHLRGFEKTQSTSRQRLVSASARAAAAAEASTSVVAAPHAEDVVGVDEGTTARASRAVRRLSANTKSEAAGSSSPSQPNEVFRFMPLSSGGTTTRAINSSTSSRSNMRPAVLGGPPPRMPKPEEGRGYALQKLHFYPERRVTSAAIGPRVGIGLGAATATSGRIPRVKNARRGSATCSTTGEIEMNHLKEVGTLIDELDIQTFRKDSPLLAAVAEDLRLSKPSASSQQHADEHEADTGAGRETATTGTELASQAIMLPPQLNAAVPSNSTSSREDVLVAPMSKQVRFGQNTTEVRFFEKRPVKSSPMSSSSGTERIRSSLSSSQEEDSSSSARSSSSSPKNNYSRRGASTSLASSWVSNFVRKTTAPSSSSSLPPTWRSTDSRIIRSNSGTTGDVTTTQKNGLPQPRLFFEGRHEMPLFPSSWVKQMSTSKATSGAADQGQMKARPQSAVSNRSLFGKARAVVPQFTRGNTRSLEEECAELQQKFLQRPVSACSTASSASRNKIAPARCSSAERYVVGGGTTSNNEDRSSSNYPMTMQDRRRSRNVFSTRNRRPSAVLAAAGRPKAFSLDESELSCAAGGGAAEPSSVPMSGGVRRRASRTREAGGPQQGAVEDAVRQQRKNKKAVAPEHASLYYEDNSDQDQEEDPDTSVNSFGEKIFEVDSINREPRKALAVERCPDSPPKPDLARMQAQLRRLKMKKGLSESGGKSGLGSSSDEDEDQGGAPFIEKVPNLFQQRGGGFDYQQPYGSSSSSCAELRGQSDSEPWSSPEIRGGGLKVKKSSSSSRRDHSGRAGADGSTSRRHDIAPPPRPNRIKINTKAQEQGAARSRLIFEGMHSSEIPARILPGAGGGVGENSGDETPPSPTADIFSPTRLPQSAGQEPSHADGDPVPRRRSRTSRRSVNRARTGGGSSSAIDTASVISKTEEETFFGLEAELEKVAVRTLNDTSTQSLVVDENRRMSLSTFTNKPGLVQQPASSPLGEMMRPGGSSRRSSKRSSRMVKKPKTVIRKAYLRGYFETAGSTSTGGARTSAYITGSDDKNNNFNSSLTVTHTQHYTIRGLPLHCRVNVSKNKPTIEFFYSKDHRMEEELAASQKAKWSSFCWHFLKPMDVAAAAAGLTSPAGRAGTKDVDEMLNEKQTQAEIIERLFPLSGVAAKEEQSKPSSSSASPSSWSAPPKKQSTFNDFRHVLDHCFSVKELRTRIMRTNPRSRLGKYLLTLVHRIFLNDKTLQSVSFSGLTSLPSSFVEKRFFPKLFKALGGDVCGKKFYTKQQYLQLNTNLRHLDLHGCGLFREEITGMDPFLVLELLTNVVARNSSLKYLDLSENDLVIPSSAHNMQGRATELLANFAAAVGKNYGLQVLSMFAVVVVNSASGGVGEQQQHKNDHISRAAGVQTSFAGSLADNLAKYNNTLLKLHCSFPSPRLKQKVDECLVRNHQMRALRYGWKL